MAFETILLQLAFLLCAAKIGGELAERCKAPAVLGELAAGMLIGPGALGALAKHIPALHPFVVSGAFEPMATLAGLGGLLLLFEAGLGADIHDLTRLAAPILWVAAAGVALPFIGGDLLMRWQGFGERESLFVGAALTATSVGVTARAFCDLNRSDSREAKIVLGAAVADDVIGLIILAVVSGATGAEAVSPAGVAKTAVSSLCFLIGVIVLGVRYAPIVLGMVARMRSRAALSTAAAAFCFALAALAKIVGGLSPIVGAFAAGLALAKTERKLRFQARIKPVADLLIPVFFVAMGAAAPLGEINPRTPSGRHVLFLAGMLFLVAVIGKVIGGATAPVRSVNRLAIGVGMTPRGEVGLIFATYGLQSGVMDGQMYMAIMFVIMLTTFVAAPLLNLILERGDNQKGGLHVREAAVAVVPATSAS